MKTRSERGSFGAWLTRVRSERFPSQEVALREYERLAGLRIAKSQYAAWESGGRVPRADNPKVARLYDFYGSRPEDEQQEAAQPLGDQAAVVAALDRQTAAIERQTVVMARLISVVTQLGPRPQTLRDLEQAERELEERRGSGDAGGAESGSEAPNQTRRLP